MLDYVSELGRIDSIAKHAAIDASIDGRKVYEKIKKNSANHIGIRKKKKKGGNKMEERLAPKRKKELRTLVKGNVRKQRIFSADKKSGSSLR